MYYWRKSSNYNTYNVNVFSLPSSSTAVGSLGDLSELLRPFSSTCATEFRSFGIVRFVERV